MAYMVDLEAFHGPLDLLLYLIDQNQVDIYDIPVALISEQFMSYLDQSGDYQLELMGDFLVMASYLLHLKARMLLPSLPGREEEEEGDPREELVQRLEEYRKYKGAAERLQAIQTGEVKRIFFRESRFKPGENEVLLADIRLLYKAYQAVFERLIDEEAEDLTIPQEDVNIAEKMSDILFLLKRNSGSLPFIELFSRVNRKRELLGLFLALLELVRQQRVTASQETSFGEIHLNLRMEMEDVDER